MRLLGGSGSNDRAEVLETEKCEIIFEIRPVSIDCFERRTHDDCLGIEAMTYGAVLGVVAAVGLTLSTAWAETTNADLWVDLSGGQTTANESFTLLGSTSRGPAERSADPASDSGRNSLLGSFSGAESDKTWSLLLADSGSGKEGVPRSLSISAIPEPATSILITLGSALFLRRFCRRKLTNSTHAHE